MNTIQKHIIIVGVPRARKTTGKNWTNFIKNISSTSNYDKLPYRLAFDMYQYINR